MKSPSFKSSKLYNPKSKPSFWADGLNATVAALRHPVIFIGAILIVIYVGFNHRGGNVRGSSQVGAAKKLHTSSNRDVILINLDEVKAATCAQHSRFMNFTSKEYQVSLEMLVAHSSAANNSFLSI